jgi:hypothetical protein
MMRFLNSTAHLLEGFLDAFLNLPLCAVVRKIWSSIRK